MDTVIGLRSTIMHSYINQRKSECFMHALRRNAKAIKKFEKLIKDKTVININYDNGRKITNFRDRINQRNFMILLYQKK